MNNGKIKSGRRRCFAFRRVATPVLSALQRYKKTLIKRIIHIEDWTAIFLFSLDGHDEREVLRGLLSCGAPESIYEQVAGNLKEDQPNTGFTYSNPTIRRSLVYISPTTSGEEFLSTFVHELAHLVRDISLTDGISLRGEKIAYLSGEIALRLSDVVCHFSCDSCRGD